MGRGREATSTPAPATRGPATRSSSLASGRVARTAPSRAVIEATTESAARTGSGRVKDEVHSSGPASPGTCRRASAARTSGRFTRIVTGVSSGNVATCPEARKVVVVVAARRYETTPTWAPRLSMAARTVGVTLVASPARLAVLRAGASAATAVAPTAAA